MTKLAAGLMQLGASMFLLPWALVLLGTGALLPLVPWGAGVAVLGFVIGLAASVRGRLAQVFRSHPARPCAVGFLGSLTF